jgi:hypothetical protein
MLCMTDRRPLGMFAVFFLGALPACTQPVANAWAVDAAASSDGAGSDGDNADGVSGHDATADGAGRADASDAASQLADTQSAQGTAADAATSPTASIADGGGADAEPDADAKPVDAVSDTVSDSVPPDNLAPDNLAPDNVAPDAGSGASGSGDAKLADTKADVSADTVAPATYDPGACKKEGAEACGKGISGDPDMLYVCNLKLQWKPLQKCQQPCQTMPNGVPDRCPEDLEVPASLVTTLDVKPYVEQSCKPTTYKDWPYAAAKCTYSQYGITTTVTTATPPAATVAAWIVDAAAFMPAVWALRYLDPPTYNKALKAVANAVLLQSSRIFPLEGGIIEAMIGTSAQVYNFYHGVTQGCSSGCYCRINSLQKENWCAYQQFLGKQAYNACIANLGATGLTVAWGDQCLTNHVNAWKTTVNQHFRAKSHQFQQSIKTKCPNSLVCLPDEVLAALQQALQ